ncbi:hypothetical protein CBI38_29455 [Rhodococcus oxybenzonivorans]|uniref:Uncharacterized protein n=1 Tax=Rhodococcus oxybenzonivorans TaxID=1990687 RepID=A0A2S2C2F5_9NOCA|nr:hypothetical protein CBI38_29455 [Rhodococcus oxybenzonivorans]
MRVGLLCGLLAAGLFLWWLSLPVTLYTAGYTPLGEGTVGTMETSETAPFLIGMGAFGWRLGRQSPPGVRQIPGQHQTEDFGTANGG